MRRAAASSESLATIATASMRYACSIDRRASIRDSTDGRAKRYDPNARRPHQHLVCTECGTIRDVRPSGDPLAALPDSERYGFTVSKVDVTYRGRCPSCAA